MLSTSQITSVITLPMYCRASYSSSEMFDSSSQTEICSDSDNATATCVTCVTAELLERLKKEFADREESLISAHIEKEAKLKKELSYKTQLVDATERKRQQLSIALHREIEKIKLEARDSRESDSNELTNLKCLLNSQSETASVLRADKEAMVEVLSANNLKIAQLEALIAGCKCDDFAITIKSLQLERDKFQREGESLAKQVTELTQQVTEASSNMNSEINSLERRLDESMHQNLTALQLKDEANLLAVEKQTQCDRMRSRLEKLAVAFEEAKVESQEQIRHLKSKSEYQKASIEQLCDVMRDLKFSRASLTTKCSELEEALGRSKANEELIRSRGETKAAELNDKLLQVEKKCAVLTASQEQSKSDACNTAWKQASDDSSSMQVVADLEQRIDALTASVKIKTVMLDDQNAAIKHYKEEIDLLEGDVADRNEQIEALEEDVQGLKKIVSDLESQIEARGTFQSHIEGLVKEISHDVIKTRFSDAVSGSSQY